MTADKVKRKRKKILFVCTGNTCRSPMAEIILKNEIKRRKIRWWDVGSCGIRAEVGGSISFNSRAALEEVGLSVGGFIPRQLTQQLIEKSALVICMTSQQKQMLEACGNVKCVRDLCGYDIPDPYGCDIAAYRATREALFRACNEIIEQFILHYKEENN